MYINFIPYHLYRGIIPYVSDKYMINCLSTKLSFIWLRYNSYIFSTELSLGQITSKFKLLSSYYNVITSIYEDEELTDDIISYLPNLTTLDLSYNPYITDFGLSNDVFA